MPNGISVIFFFFSKTHLENCMPNIVQAKLTVYCLPFEFDLTFPFRIRFQPSSVLFAEIYSSSTQHSVDRAPVSFLDQIFPIGCDWRLLNVSLCLTLCSESTATFVYFAGGVQCCCCFGANEVRCFADCWCISFTKLRRQSQIPDA